MKQAVSFEFDEFRLDSSAQLLLRNEHPVQLSPKALRILTILVANAGTTISKDDLLRSVWPDTFVEEGNIAVHVAELRRAFGDDGRESAFIQTVTRRGYRFLRPVRRSALFRCGSGRSGDVLCELAFHFLAQQSFSGFDRAELLFRQCIRDNPNHVVAYSGLAHCLMSKSALGWLDPFKVNEILGPLLATAAAIDSCSPEVQTAIARRLAWGIGSNYGQADQSYARAVIVAPHSGLARACYGTYSVRGGALDRGIEQLQLAVQLDPISPIMRGQLIDALYLAEDLNACICACEEAVLLHPYNWSILASAGRAYAARSDYRSAARHYKRAISLGGEVGQNLLRSELACLQVHTARSEGVSKIVCHLLKKPGSDALSFVALARIYTAGGLLEDAEACLDRAYASGDPNLTWIRQDIRFAPLRSHLRFRSLISRIGL